MKKRQHDFFVVIQFKDANGNEETRVVELASIRTDRDDPAEFGEELIRAFKGYEAIRTSLGLAKASPSWSVQFRSSSRDL